MGTYKALGMCSEADQYITKRGDLMRIYKEIVETCDDFICRYDGFLKDSERCYTIQLIWGLRSVMEYKRKFLVLVLMNSYKVFDETHKRYLELLNVVKENNPEWLELVINDHEAKLRRCKVSVFPLEEALTA